MIQLSATEFGELPVFYTTQPPFAHSRSVGDLIARGAPTDVDYDTLTTHLAELTHWGDLYRGIASLRPGETVAVDSGVLRRQRQIPAPVSADWLDAPAPQLAAELRERLLQAVSRTIGNARVVTILVGGVDSSGVLGALAQVISRDRIRVVTLTPDPHDLDPDLPYVEELCRHLGVRMTQFPWSVADCALEDILITDELPSYTSYFVEKRAFEDLLESFGADVLLSANGGDTIFGGTFEELAHRIFASPRAAAQAFCAELPWNTSLRYRARWIVGEALEPILERRPRRFPAYFGRRLREHRPSRTVVPRTPHERMKDWYNSPNLVTATQYGAARMAHLGIPFRDVSVDVPLMQFLASVPIETLNCDRRFRGLYHRAIEPWVTERVANRRTKSLQDELVGLPPATEAALRDLAHATRLEAAGFVVAKELLATFDSGERNGLWHFLAAEAWLRRNAS